MVKVSIIVPFFNEEERISNCITSLLNSTYEDYELLLIDDGSNDRSFEICVDYEKEDCRIRTFQLERGGVSKARNFGIEKAEGEYIWFVDGDDEVYKDSLENLMDGINKYDVDITIGNYNSTRGDVNNRFEGVKDIDYYIDEMCRDNGFYYYVLWNKIYKKSIIIENNVRFDEEAFFAQDSLFNLDYCQYCKNVYYKAQSVYYYAEGNSFNCSQKSTYAREKVIIDILFKQLKKKNQLVTNYNLDSGIKNTISQNYFYTIQEELKKTIKLASKENGKSFKQLFKTIWEREDYQEIIDIKYIEGYSFKLAKLSKNLKLPYLYYLYCKFK